VREAVTTKRVPVPGRNVGIVMLKEEDPLPFIDRSIDDYECQSYPPPGAFIVADPYETYVNAHPNEEPSEDLAVATEAQTLRAISLLVNNKENINAIIDPGSQIIAMSEPICHSLGLTYDPRVRIKMQSANGEVDRSLGLSRNVSCRVGNITLYLQIHVIRNAAYDVLLGRPFDVLTRSVAKNFPDGFQTLTICDPNTGEITTIPTMEPKPPRYKPACRRHKQGLHSAEDDFLGIRRN
jgi:hypothetical protein